MLSRFRPLNGLILTCEMGSGLLVDGASGDPVPIRPIARRLVLGVATDRSWSNRRALVRCDGAVESLEWRFRGQPSRERTISVGTGVRTAGISYEVKRAGLSLSRRGTGRLGRRPI